MKKIYFTFIVLSILKFQFLSAQTVFFNNFNFQNLTQGPQMAGYNKGGILLNQQISSTFGDIKFSNFNLQADKSINIGNGELGIGLQLNYDNSLISENMVGLNLAYRNSVFKNENSSHTVGLGIKATINRIIYSNEIRWPSQIDSNGVFNPNAPGETLLPFTYLNFTPGIMYAFKYKNTSFTAGATITGINKVDVFLVDKYSYRDISLDYFLTANFSVSDGINLMPKMGLYNAKGKDFNGEKINDYHYNFGLDAKCNITDHNDIILGYGKTKTGNYLTFGYMYKNMNFIASYDFTEDKNATFDYHRGELTLKYIFGDQK